MLLNAKIGTTLSIVGHTSLFKRGSFSMKINELMFSDGGAKPIFFLRPTRLGPCQIFLGLPRYLHKSSMFLKKCFLLYDIQTIESGIQIKLSAKPFYKVVLIHYQKYFLKESISKTFLRDSGSLSITRSVQIDPNYLIDVSNPNSR